MSALVQMLRRNRWVRHAGQTVVPTEKRPSQVCATLFDSVSDEFFFPPGIRHDGDLAYPDQPHPASQRKLSSCVCTEKDFHTKAFRHWCCQIAEEWRLHRKLWEYLYICQALYERGMLSAGRRGLGFAVGLEPLPSLFASKGVQIVASDLCASDPRAELWANSQQLASNLQQLNQRGLCEPGRFTELVSFRNVDMNEIPDDLRDFDFTWSSCSFEHCGSIELGQRFICEQMKCLKPGGIAVHTTELNLTSNDETIATGATVLFRRRDIEEIAARLTADGHRVERIDPDLGSSPTDHYIDLAPYSSAPHLKLQLGGYVTTSIGLIVEKAS